MSGAAKFGCERRHERAVCLADVSELLRARSVARALRLRHIMADRPWQIAGVSRSRWERARRAVVDRIADAVWRARGRSRSDMRFRVEEPMQRLSGIARGDPDAIRYGLDLAESEVERDDGAKPH